MLSINTNISSLVAQRSLTNSTQLLNKAIERMSTGFQINHASDNAANYSISNNMTTKLGAYQVAEDNVSTGLDLLSTASDSLNLINDKLTRLRALAEQAANGTYGEQSLKAINSEARALVDEANRVYNTTEYNGQKLFGHSGQFIADIQVRDTSKMNTLSSVDSNTTITSGTYSISSAEELEKLAIMTNSGKIRGGEYVLAADIDLSAYSEDEGWVRIGSQNWSDNHFNGVFDGNGHVVSNLYINRSSGINNGLFGCAQGVIKNLGIENANVTGKSQVGALVGIAMQEGQAGNTNTSLVIENCYVKDSNINGGESCGGIIGEVRSKNFKINNCYSDIIINSNYTNNGGLIGRLINSNNSTIVENCFALGKINASESNHGGLIGNISNSNSTIIKNCFTDVDINTAKDQVGGFIGCIWYCKDVNITNCYALGNVTSTTNTGYGNLGGFLGVMDANTTVNISHCYSTGDVTAITRAGGFIGHSGTSGCTLNISDCYSTGNVTGTNYAGGLVAYNAGTISIKNSYALGSATNKLSGILLGYSSNNNVTIENCGYGSKLEATGKPICARSLPKGNINNTSVYKGKDVPFKIGDGYFDLQVGIDGSLNSQIDIETSFSLYGICDLYKIGLDNKDYLSKIDELTAKISAKQVELGSAENRLESALSEISTKYENLASSRSTLRDADIANVSSEYIKQQILQQASATLLSTANQSPALALQLL